MGASELQTARCCEFICSKGRWLVDSLCQSPRLHDRQRREVESGPEETRGQSKRLPTVWCAVLQRFRNASENQSKVRTSKVDGLIRESIQIRVGFVFLQGLQVIEPLEEQQIRDLLHHLKHRSMHRYFERSMARGRMRGLRRLIGGCLLFWLGSTELKLLG